MKGMPRLCGAVLEPARHCDMMCTVMKFAQWCLALSKESEEQEILQEDGKNCLQKRETWVRPLLKVQSGPQYYNLAAGP